jgi:hypothetical protein
MGAPNRVPSGQLQQLLLVWALCFYGFCQPCVAFAPNNVVSPTKRTQSERQERFATESSLLGFRVRSSSPQPALATAPRDNDTGVSAKRATTNTIDIDDHTAEKKIGNNLEPVKFLTTSAIFQCGTEEGLIALRVLNELCERRLPFDFDSFFSRQEKDRTTDQDCDTAADAAVCTSNTNTNPDKGERVISLLPKFLPEKTTNDFLESVRVMEKQGWMSTNPDSVDGLPSLHLNLVSQRKPLFASSNEEEEDVSFGSQIHKLYDLVRPFIYETLLPEADRLLRRNGRANNSTRTLRVSDVFLRRYGEEICGSMTRKGISTHYDVYSRITAVVALDEVASKGDNGLFTLLVDEQTGETSNHKALRRFFPLTSGDCVLHTWDVLHGVDVRDGLDRTSLIVWFDEEDEDDEIIPREGDTPFSNTCNDESTLLSPWLSLEHQGSSPSGVRTTLGDGNDVRQFVLASALSSASSTEAESEEAIATSLYLTSASQGNTFALTRMGSICEEGTLSSPELKTEAFRVLDELRPFEELPKILRDMLKSQHNQCDDADDGDVDKDAAERTELACRFWLEASLTGNPLAQKSLADEVMFEASQSGNPDQRLLAATLFALASQQEDDTEEGPSDALTRVIGYDVAIRGVESREEFLASPVVQTAKAALGGH